MCTCYDLKKPSIRRFLSWHAIPPSRSCVSMYATSLPRSESICRFASSQGALEALRAGHAHIAGTHLHNTGGGESNVLAAGKKLAGLKAAIIGFSLFENTLPLESS